MTQGAARHRAGDDDSAAALFKEGFRHHAAGVALACAATPDGPVGATLSSVASVSADPPLLSFSMATTSSAGAALVGSDEVDVYLLRADQVALAEAFARRGAERFTPGQGWHRPAGRDLPVLDGAAARFSGRPEAVIPAGSSWLVLLAVTDVVLGEPGAPLLHHDRRYWAPGALPTSGPPPTVPGTGEGLRQLRRDSSRNAGPTSRS